VTFALDGTAGDPGDWLETWTASPMRGSWLGKTATTPWEIVLLDAVTDHGAYQSLKYAVTKARGPVQLSDTSADISSNSQQRIGWGGHGLV